MSARTDDQMVRLARSCWGALESLHVIGYFAVETAQAYEAIGLRSRTGYFASRSAAMGPVTAPMTQATFYVFAPRTVEAALPAAWSVATPDAVTQARRQGVEAALHRILDPVLVEASVDEAVGLARTATEGLTPGGRVLYAAHSALTWPTAPMLQLWHAATLIREHRGDGHVNALLHADVAPLEALVISGIASGNTAFLRERRGWTGDEWTATRASLAEQGLLVSALDTTSGAATDTLSPAGQELRSGLEQQTDRAAVEGWAHLGADGSRRLLDLVAPLRDAMLAAPDLPEWIGKRR